MSLPNRVILFFLLLLLLFFAVVVFVVVREKVKNLKKSIFRKEGGKAEGCDGIKNAKGHQILGNILDQVMPL